MAEGRVTVPDVDEMQYTRDPESGASVLLVRERWFDPIQSRIRSRIGFAFDCPAPKSIYDPMPQLDYHLEIRTEFDGKITFKFGRDMLIAHLNRRHEMDEAQLSVTRC